MLILATGNRVVPTEILTDNGTFVAPKSGTYVVWVIGGGGGGGRDLGTGGGSGFLTFKIIPLEKSEQVAVVIGQGGGPAVPEINQDVGWPGGLSSFGAFLSGAGGSPGQRVAGGAVTGGSGGSGGGSIYNNVGGNGGWNGSPGPIVPGSGSFAGGAGQGVFFDGPTDARIVIGRLTIGAGNPGVSGNATNASGAGGGGGLFVPGFSVNGQNGSTSTGGQGFGGGGGGGDGSGSRFGGSGVPGVVVIHGPI